MAEKRPKWLDEYRRRTAIIDVIADAFDPDISAEDVRQRLKEVAEDLEDLFMPPAPQTPRRRSSRRS